MTAQSNISKKSQFCSASLQKCQLLLKEISAYSTLSQCTVQFVIILAGKQMFSCTQKGFRCLLQSKGLEHYVNYLSYCRELLNSPF